MRNDLGQVTKVEQPADGEAPTLQEITYDSTTHRLQTVSAPGHGIQSFTYDTSSGQLKSATGADGVIASVQSREPLSDALRELVSDRGPGGTMTSSFRYDGMERMTRRWTDFGGSSEAQPLESIHYQFPTADSPGLIQTDSLIDAAAQTRKRSAAWMYPDGKELAAADRIPGAWVFDGVTNRSRTELRSTDLRRSPLADAMDPAVATYGTIRDQATFLSETLTAGFGHNVSARDVLQQGVERQVANTLLMEGGLVVTVSRENDTLETRTAVDAGGRLNWVLNQAGDKTHFTHDALGRLIRVILVDGTVHRLSFDAFGRPALIDRDNIGTVAYTYEPVTGRLKHKEYRDADGSLERTVDFTYDAIGRVVHRAHVQPRTGDEAHFAFRHDGDVGDGEVIPGQKGYATRVDGPDYTATVVRNPDGSEASSTLILAQWMQVDTTSTYYAGGALRESHRTITRLSDGAVIDDVAIGHVYDAWGRLERMTANGVDLATIHYDSEGRLAQVDLPNGQRIDHLYDPVTHGQSGYSQQVKGESGTWMTGVDWIFNDRGLIGSEAIGLGDQSWLRTYQYDSRGFLRESEDADWTSTYTYTSTGLPDRISDEKGTRTVFRGRSRTITVDGIPYEYDASGRVAVRGDVSFTYGPDGNLSIAERGSRTLSYQYDADGNRLLKYENTVPMAAYVGGGYLTEDTFVDPVKIGGRLVGLLEHGTFQALATDPRGTVIADRTGAPRLATPYGVRSVRPDWSAALDYIEKAYDADLDSIRMGVRDYDPLIGQFWTPDPLYLEAIDECAASPVGCNLVSYTHNNPINLFDPTGTEANEFPLFREWLFSRLSRRDESRVTRDEIVERLRDADPDNFGINMARFERGDRNALGPAFRDAQSAFDHAGAVLFAAHLVRPWIRRELNKGRTPTFEEMDRQSLYAGGFRATLHQIVGGFLGAAYIRAPVAARRGAQALQACFAANTKIETIEGTKIIAEVEVGDQVWSYDAEASEWGWRAVTETFVHRYEGRVYRLEIGNERIDVTGNHPICVATGKALATRPEPPDIGEDPLDCDKGGRWVEARDVQIGDTVVLARRTALVAGVGSYDGSLLVYNVSVSDAYTYSVSTERLLVHNKSVPASPTTLFRPTQTARHFDFAKVDRYADMMRKGTWDWSADKIIVDKAGSIMSGHHRVLAAERAGVQIPESAIFRVDRVTARPVYDWDDIIP